MWIRALALTLLLPLAHADVLTVGPSGSGADFEQIQDAIGAAQPGDTILVEAGNYNAFVLTKPLRILGAGKDVVGVFGQPAFAGIPLTLVENIPAGEEVVLSGMLFTAFPVGPTVWLRDSPGATMILNDVASAGGAALYGLGVNDVGRAIVIDSDFVGASGLGFAAVDVSESELWLVDTNVAGQNGGLVIPTPPAPTEALPGDDALHAVNSTVYVYRGSIHGGDGNDFGAFGDPYGETGTPLGGRAVVATNSTITVFGGPGASILGGDGGITMEGGTTFYEGGAGMDLSLGSTATVQDDMLFGGGHDGSVSFLAPSFVVDGTSSGSLDPTVYATLGVDSPENLLGETADFDVCGTPGGSAVLYASLTPGPTVEFPGVLGASALDLGALAPVGAGTVDPGGCTTVSVPIPPAPALIGFSPFFQAVEFAGLQIGLSNPVTVAVIG